MFRISSIELLVNRGPDTTVTDVSDNDSDESFLVQR